MKDVQYVYEPRRSTNKTRLVLKSPKTESSQRMVFIPDSLVNDLKHWKSLQPRFDDVKCPNLIIAGDNGTPFGERQLSKLFHCLLDQCELPSVVFSSLRHTSTTYKLGISNGNIKAVQYDNGHTTANMVLRVYARSIDDERRKIADSFDKTLYRFL